jgi:membrane protease subunit HflK
VKRLAIVIVGLLLLASYLATGLVVVGPGEVVVVRRFGRVLSPPWGPGPHFGAPIGIDRRDRVRIDHVRAIELGRGGPDEEAGAGEYLTADLNLVRARGLAQYRVDDPVAFVTQAADVEALLARLTEADLARVLARTPIDEALRASGASVALEVERSLRDEAHRRRIGVEVLSVRLTEARPPAEVRPDFDAAQSARDEVERRLVEARTRADVMRGAARAAALARNEGANAYANRTMTLAQARAERFQTLLDECRRDRSLTVERLYRDGLKDLFPRVRRKLVLGPDETFDLSILGVAP